MRAQVGDRITLAAERVGQLTRDGTILEVRGDDGAPPYVVRWSDGRTGFVAPGPGSVLRLVHDEDAAPSPAPAAPGP